jgi:hypothetical protein
MPTNAALEEKIECNDSTMLPTMFHTSPPSPLFSLLVLTTSVEHSLRWIRKCITQLLDQSLPSIPLRFA